MLVVYRTNKGFEGQIVSIDRTSTPAAMDVWLAMDPQRSADTAYLYLDERLLRYELLSDLIASPDAYSVNPVSRQVVRGGVAVDLGYIPGVADASLVAIRSDPEVRALMEMDDAAVLTWVEGKTSNELLATLYRTLRDVLRATAVVE